MEDKSADAGRYRPLLRAQNYYHTATTTCIHAAMQKRVSSIAEASAECRVPSLRLLTNDEIASLARFGLRTNGVLVGSPAAVGRYLLTLRPGQAIAIHHLGGGVQFMVQEQQDHRCSAPDLTLQRSAPLLRFRCGSRISSSRCSINVQRVMVIAQQP